MFFLSHGVAYDSFWINSLCIGGTQVILLQLHDRIFHVKTCAIIQYPIFQGFSWSFPPAANLRGCYYRWVIIES